MKTSEWAVHRLKELGRNENATGMRKFGISGKGILGVKVPDIRMIAREIGKNHRIAMELWDTKLHEARILATMVEDPAAMDAEQAEKWVRDLESWDLCDHFCGNLIALTGSADALLRKWTQSNSEFVRRAGFVLMAELAVKDRKLEDSVFTEYLDIIENTVPDARNFVKKAVNWALRQIGKRNMALNREAARIAQRMKDSEEKSTRWIGSDALRELTGEPVLRRLSK